MRIGSKITFIGATVFLIGLGIFIIGKNTNNNESQVGSKDSITIEENVLGLNYDFLSQPYRLMVNSENPLSTSIIETDGSGNYNLVSITNGQSLSILYVDGINYSKNSDTEQWIKYPQNSNNNTLPDSQLGFSRDGINKFNTNEFVKFSHTEPCGNNMCRIYSGVIDGDLGTIKIDDETNRLIEIETMNLDNDVVTIKYEYPAQITITAPAEFQELPVI